MDDSLALGLGALDSPLDPRDWSWRDLADAAGDGAAPADVPPSYSAPSPMPPVFSQGSTPQCVAYASAGSKLWQDLRDSGPFSPGFSAFFTRIGGTSQGAVPRDALAHMLGFGYPESDGQHEDAHRIAAYAAVPLDRDSVCRALMAMGPLLLSLRWHSSWFRPLPGGVLPEPSGAIGGHLVLAVGWTPEGLRCRNSWGPLWGDGGDFLLPWAHFAEAKECWSTVDRLTPKPLRWAIAIAPHAVVTHYGLDAAGRLTDTHRLQWGVKASTAPCLAPVVKRGAKSGSALVAKATRGVFSGRYVRIGSGTTVKGA